jgi:hypothetical protein
MGQKLLSMTPKIVLWPGEDGFLATLEAKGAM